MIGEYLGVLPGSDPLYRYLKYEIFPRIGGAPTPCGFRVFKTNGSNMVYMYEEMVSNIRVIGKFFFSERMTDPALASKRLEREFQNLEDIRARGFNSGLHYVARPLGRHHNLGRLLVEEFCYGEPMDVVIRRSIKEKNDALLFEKLSALAFFLANLHNRTAAGGGINFNECRQYGCKVIRALAESGLIDGDEYGQLQRLCSRWCEQSCMWEDMPVIVHGDATPSNFLFGDGMHVIAFDLERVRRTDRVFDVGRLAGELFHFFLQNTGNKYDAEPFIGHFLWEYACHFPDRDRAFASITRRVPYYMGTTLLRIARNRYLDWQYRRRLIDEAKLCLRSDIA